MSLSSYASTKIRVLSLFSMMLVVFLHAYNLEGVAPYEVPLHFGSPVWWLQDWVSYGITRVAVPLFFVFSGFLFFLHHSGPNVFFEKMKKRARTLLVPFLFWSLAGIAFYFTLQSLPQTAGFFTKQRVVDFSFPDWMRTVFITPIPYQFWFVRDLMVLVLLSPVLFRCLKALRFWWLILLAIPWILVDDLWKNSAEAALFFCAGGYYAIYKPETIEKRWPGNAAFLVPAWLLLLLLKTYMLQRGVDWLFTRLVFKLSILTGLLAVWSLYDQIFKNRAVPGWLLWLCGFTFFIYAAHEPMLTIFKKILFVIFGTQQNAALVVYFLAPTLTLCGTVVLGWILRNMAGKFYELITGGR